MTKESPNQQPAAPIKMVPNKDNILVPADKVDRCLHKSVIRRIKPQLPEYVCKEAEDGCSEKLKFVTLTWALMTEKEFNTFQAIQARNMAAMIRQQRTGLVTPGEANAEAAQKRQPRVVPPRKGPA